MSREVVPQLDLGSLSVNSLSAFTSILTAVSADNVSPVSLIQLSALGSHFHISGPYAAQTPDLLQRVASTRIDRLGIVIGWRKGDAASYMAHSAGGQAASLLCLCLQNFLCHKSAKTGEILYDISGRILARDQAVASIKQLGDAAELLTNKLAPIGFGNIIAREAVRIQSIYESLGKAAPTDIYNSLTRDSIVNLLESLAYVFAGEDCQLRITGTVSAAFLLAMARILFGEDLLLVVEEHIIHAGARHRIILDVTCSEEKSGNTRIDIEHRLRQTPHRTLQLQFEALNHVGPQHQFAYTWRGHLRDFLDTSFSSVGLSCPEFLVVACCDEVLQLIQRKTIPPSPDVVTFPVASIEDLLGADPISRVYQTFQMILRTTPSGNHTNEESSLFNLASCFQYAIKHIKCTCDGSYRCDWSRGWKASLKARSKQCLWCIPRFLWLAVGHTICHALTCILVDTPELTPVRLESSKLPDCISLESFEEFRRDDPIRRWRSCNAIYHEVFTRFGALRTCENPLAASNGMSTLLPWVLVNLRLNSELGVSFPLIDGQIVLKNQYYRHMDSVQTASRKRQKAQPKSRDRMFSPCSTGAHSDTHFAVMENADGLVLRCTIINRERSRMMDLFDPTLGSMGLVEGRPCEHDPDAALDDALVDQVRATSVLSPLTNAVDAEGGGDDGKIAIVQTRSNPMAQLLACTGETRALLQRTCCLNCAVREAMELEIWQIIVACE